MQFSSIRLSQKWVIDVVGKKSEAQDLRVPLQRKVVIVVAFSSHDIASDGASVARPPKYRAKAAEPLSRPIP